MGLIKQIDDQLGVLFAFMRERGLLDNTMIVFTSDHGDYLGDHWLGEKDLFHEPSVKMPLIVYDPSADGDAARGSGVRRAGGIDRSRADLPRRARLPIRPSSRTVSKAARCCRGCAANAPQEWRRVRLQRIRLFDDADGQCVRRRAARCPPVHGLRPALEIRPRGRLPADAVRPRERSRRVARSRPRSGLSGRTRPARRRAQPLGAAAVAANHVSDTQIHRHARQSAPAARHFDRVWDEMDIPEELWVRYRGEGASRRNMIGRNRPATGRGDRPCTSVGLCNLSRSQSARSRCLPCPVAGWRRADPHHLSVRRGGTGDALARMVADKMRTSLNRPVIVENRTVVYGRIAVQAVKSAAPDGNHAADDSDRTGAVYQLVYKFGLRSVHDSSRYRSSPPSISASPWSAKCRRSRSRNWSPGRRRSNAANYGTPPPGRLPHFLAHLFGARTGMDLRDVILSRGRPRALTDVVGRPYPDGVDNHVRPGGNAQRRASFACWRPPIAQRSQFLPDVPTFREAGFDLVRRPAGTGCLRLPRLRRMCRASQQGGGEPSSRRTCSERMLAAGLVDLGSARAGPAVAARRHHHHLGADVDAAVEVGDVVVGEADAARRHAAGRWSSARWCRGCGRCSSRDTWRGRRAGCPGRRP